MVDPRGPGGMDDPSSSELVEVLVLAMSEMSQTIQYDVVRIALLLGSKVRSLWRFTI